MSVSVQANGSKRINLLVMISSLRGGGSERQAWMLLKSLDRDRFHPFLYVTERAGEFLSAVPDDVQILSHEDCPQSARMYFPGAALKRQSEYLRTLLEQHAIDVIYDRTFHMTLVAGPAATQLGIPRVSTIVSPPHLALPLVERRFVAMKRRRLAKCYRSGSRVIAVSQQAAESAATYYRLDGLNITVVPNPVDLDSFNAVAVGNKARNEPIRFVCVGRMTHEKGQADLLHAVARLKSTCDTAMQVDFVGDGPLRTSLQHTARTLGLDGEVEFLGHLPDATSKIAAADALVLPSHFEGMPNVVLEAMALGTPVIATQAGGTIELEREEPTVFWAQPCDAESLSNAISRFLAEPETARRHTVSARRMIETHHDLRQTTRRLEQIFLDVIKKN